MLAELAALLAALKETGKCKPCGGSKLYCCPPNSKCVHAGRPCSTCAGTGLQPAAASALEGWAQREPLESNLALRDEVVQFARGMGADTQGMGADVTLFLRRIDREVFGASTSTSSSTGEDPRGGSAG